MALTDTLSLSDFLVFVSGATGFLGKALVSGLTQCGASICPLTRDLSLELSSADCRKKKVFVHLAGMVHAGQCEENPLQAFEANVSHAIRALLFCQKQGIDFFIFPSTGAVYGDRNDQPARENNPVYTSSIYTATKLAAEALIQSYGNRFGIQTLIVRLANVYGSGCHPDSVIGTIFRQITSNSPITLRDLTPIRDFIYKEDVVQGFIQLLKTIDVHSEKIVNLSTGEGTSIQQLVETICRLSSTPSDRIRCPENRTGPISQIVLDNTLLKKTTHWHPRHNLEKGLREMLKS